ncbi:hypothetical protein GCM10029978_112810 [Actinoallomurus acanthiterrae]
MRGLTVVCIDDHQMFVRLLADRLDKLLSPRGCRVLAPYGDVAKVPPVGGVGVALCDIQLRGRLSGAEAVRRLRATGWRVLLISAQAPPRQVLESIAAGAQGYLDTSAPDARLAEAITAVAAGELYLSTELAALLYAELRGAETGLGSGDLAVLRSFAAGESGRQVAQRYDRTPSDLQAVFNRIFAAVVRSVARHELSPLERRIARLVGCGDATYALDIAAILGINRTKLNNHLKLILQKYVDAHPGLVARDGTHWVLWATGQRLEQRAAARLWAKELGLCAENAPLSGD